MTEKLTQLIVNYLPPAMNDNELYSMFITIGPVAQCNVMKDNKTGYSYGYGFVHFTKPEDAAKAIERLNGLEVHNKHIKVSYARPSGKDIKNTNLYVSNLPRHYREIDIVNLFGSYGKIIQKNLLMDKTTGLFKGVAFVRYDRRDEAQLAIENMDGFIPEGAVEAINVKVCEDHGKQKAQYYAGWQAGMMQCRGGRLNIPRGPLGTGNSPIGQTMMGCGGVIRGPPQRPCGGPLVNALGSVGRGSSPRNQFMIGRGGGRGGRPDEPSEGSVRSSPRGQAIIGCGVGMRGGNNTINNHAVSYPIRGLNYGIGALRRGRLQHRYSPSGISFGMQDNGKPNYCEAKPFY